MEIIFRMAEEKDLNYILAIYNYAILNTTATFDTEIKSIENRKEWLRTRNQNFPVIVAINNEEVLGFAALNKWSDKKAYDITAELSIYLHPEFQNKGLGSKLFKEILLRATSTKLVSLISRITEGNDQSIYMHLNAGFTKVGVLQECGEKFGKKLDVHLFQKMIN